jgi:hypothetical protein
LGGINYPDVCCLLVMKTDELPGGHQKRIPMERQGQAGMVSGQFGVGGYAAEISAADKHAAGVKGFAYRASSAVADSIVRMPYSSEHCSCMYRYSAGRTPSTTV